MTSIITLKRPGSGPAYRTRPVYFFVTVKSAPLQNHSGAVVAHDIAPRHSISIKENGASAPLLHSRATLAHERRRRSPKEWKLGAGERTEKAREDLLKVTRVLGDKSSDLEDLDKELAPVRRRRDEIKSAIMDTHHQGMNRVVFMFENRKERVPMFRRLDEISQKWGKRFSERNLMAAEIKSLEREADQLRRVIDGKRS